jgi:hypothetical protein
MTEVNYNKYLLAIVPPLYVVKYLETLRNKILKNSNTPTSLPPSIVIFKQFEWNSSEEYLLVHYLKNIVPICHSLNIELNGVKTCNKNKSLFIEIENYRELEKTLQIIQKNFFELHHKTLTTPDLFQHQQTNLFIAHSNEKNLNINNLQQHKNFYGTFIADKISLFQYNGNNWQLKYNFDLD